MEKIVELIKQDPARLSALEDVRSLRLPQCYIAAGFVRNLVWDSLHQLSKPTPLNDVDVIYFDPEESDANVYLHYEAQLRARMPELRWQVRNQASMHLRNGDEPYTSVLDAMSYWPEKETAVAIRQIGHGKYECIAAFGFESLLDGHITYNPKRSLEVFERRVKSKGWLMRWPDLSVTNNIDFIIKNH
ncbi:nucleotidyltransferase family protein [Vibrio maerlii]|uniref:nucleotidyltransferase family protein n=1 Tax=Vibrio maerlii TaxID=2231648 RepID=UPI000E3C2425|nr:nucleotidyltransferase family protein [Vibrio maerlii]